MGEILIGLEIGKAKLYKELGGCCSTYSSEYLKNLIKFIESREDALKNILLSVDEGKTPIWDMMKIQLF